MQEITKQLEAIHDGQQLNTALASFVSKDAENLIRAAALFASDAVFNFQDDLLDKALALGKAAAEFAYAYNEASK